MHKFFWLLLICFTPLLASDIVLDEYLGINDSISNSYAYKLEYESSFSLNPSVVAVTSQLYSSDEGYYNIPQNFAFRLVTNLEGENWDLQFGVLRWSVTNEAFYHKTSYEISFGFYVNDIEFRISQYTDQYQLTKNFNLTSIYFYKEY